MSLFNRSRRHTDIPPVADHEALVSRYQHLRLVSRNLNDKLAELLSKDMVYEGGRKLGVLNGETLVLTSEDASSALMDYCIYDVRRDGQNAFEKYLESSPSDIEPDELVCLRAMQNAIYSIFVVETIERGVGVTVQDLRTNEIHFVIDNGLSNSGEPGMAMVSRLLFHDGFAMTTGAGLPLGYMPSDRGTTFTKALLTVLEPDHDGYFDPAPLIRDCLSHGASSKGEYFESEDLGGGLQPLTARERRAQAEPYAPCPCGSGKKFKFCCLKRR